MKRKLKWLAIVLAVSLLGFGTAFLLSPRDRITAESWKQIQIGMSEKEVEGVLGEPGLNWVQVHEAELEYSETFGKVPRGTGIFFWEPENPVDFHPEAMKTWKSKHRCIEIQFDWQGHVIRKGYYELQRLQPLNPTFLDRFRDWLGL